MKFGLLSVLLLSILGAAASTALLHQHSIAYHIQVAYQNHIFAGALPLGISQGLEVRFQGQDAFVSGTARTREGNRADAQKQITAFLLQIPVDKIIGGPSPAVDRVHFEKEAFLVVAENRPWVAMSANGDNILLHGLVADGVTKFRIGQAAMLKNPIATLSNQISVDPTATLNIDLDTTLAAIPLIPAEQPRTLHAAAWLGESWQSWASNTPERQLRVALREFFSDAQELDEFLPPDPPTSPSAEDDSKVPPFHEAPPLAVP